MESINPKALLNQHGQNDLQEPLISVDPKCVVGVENSFPNRMFTEEEARGPLEQDGTEQSNLAHLSGLRTFGILSECLKVFRAQKTILWRTIWFVGLPYTIAQTALFAATNLSIVFLTTLMGTLIHDTLGPTYSTSYHNTFGWLGDAVGEYSLLGFVTSATFWTATVKVLICTSLLLALGFGTMMMGGLIVEWSSVYMRRVAILVRVFYIQRFSSGNSSYDVTTLAELLSSTEDLSSSKGVLRDIFYRLQNSCMAFFLLIMISQTPYTFTWGIDIWNPTSKSNFNVYISLLFIINGKSLLSNFATPLSTFVASTERCRNYGCIRRAKLLTTGEKSSTAVRLRILLHALCIPQIMVIIIFSVWIINGSDSHASLWQPRWQSWGMPLALLAFHAVWGTFNTMVSTMVAGVLYFSCKASLGENITDLPRGMPLAPLVEQKCITENQSGIKSV